MEALESFVYGSWGAALIGVLFFLAGVAAAITWGFRGDGIRAVKIAAVPFMVIAILGILPPSSEADRLKAWTAYRDANCKQIDRRVVAGEQGQSVTGFAATSKGLAPAVAFTSGTDDRIVTGWECKDGKLYTTSNSAAPNNYVAPADTSRDGAGSATL